MKSVNWKWRAMKGEAELESQVVSLDFPHRERKCDLGIVLWQRTKAREERAALGMLISNRNRRGGDRGARKGICTRAAVCSGASEIAGAVEQAITRVIQV